MSTKDATIQKAIEVATNNNATIFSNENVVYIMGGSFILGSLFTVFILVMLDFMRRDKAAK